VSNEILISIIIPVYNAEKYLNKCLDSILIENANIEVVCVIDGSTDNSENICKTYQNHDSRVKVYVQENQGVSAARNNGLKHAVGQWILFVDADDYLENDYFNAISRITEGTDIAFFASNWEEKLDQSKLPNVCEFEQKDKEYLIRQMIKSSTFTPNSGCPLRSPCFKAYRRELLLKNNILFPIGVTIGEDFIFNINAYTSANKITYYPIPIYNVVKNEGSATHRFVEDMIQKEIKFQSELKRTLVRCNMYDNCINEFNSEQKSGILRCLRKQVFSGEYTENEKKQLLNSILNNEILNTAFNTRDNNFKRSLILFCVKHKLILCLDCIFKLFNKGNY